MSNITIEQVIILVFLVSFFGHLCAVGVISWYAQVVQESRNRAARFELEAFDDVLGRIAEKAEWMKELTDQHSDPPDGPPQV